MTDHTCSFFCDRPECIRTQRDALRDGMEKLIAAERADEREACAKFAENELKNTAILTSLPEKSSAAWNILQAIRARGTK